MNPFQIPMKLMRRTYSWRKYAFLMLFAGALGLGIGLGGFTFYYADGLSYLSDDPKACANCHIMDSHYKAWLKSSHRHVATCNDCHTPDHFIGKWVTKAQNGFWHSYAFTLMNFHEPIRATSRNVNITQDRCLDCHKAITRNMFGPHASVETARCLSCHREVGHPYE